MDVAAENIVTRLEVLGYLTLVVLMVSWMAWKFGFYRYIKSQDDRSAITLKNVLTVFILFLSVELILIPLLFMGWRSWKEGKWVDIHSLKVDMITQGWLNLIGIGLLALILGIYCYLMGRSLQKSVWRQNAFDGFKQEFKDFLFGALTWIIAFPIMAWVGQAINIVLPFIYEGPHIDQVAVKHLKSVLNYPVLFWILVAAIIFVVPIIEELLFRGFVQTWLKEAMGGAKAIVATAALFSFFHFSLDQGVANVELVISLFILGCYLGYIYERQQSLWAPIGLHSTFNAISIWMILHTFE